MVFLSREPSGPGVVVVKGTGDSADRLAADLADGPQLDPVDREYGTPTFWGVDVDAMPAPQSLAHIVRQANQRDDLTFVTFSPGARDLSVRRALVGDGMWPPSWSMAALDPGLSPAQVRWELLRNKWRFEKGVTVARE